MADDSCTHLPRQQPPLTHPCLPADQKQPLSPTHGRHRITTTHPYQDLRRESRPGGGSGTQAPRKRLHAPLKECGRRIRQGRRGLRSHCASSRRGGGWEMELRGSAASAARRRRRRRRELRRWQLGMGSKGRRGRREGQGCVRSRGSRREGGRGGHCGSGWRRRRQRGQDGCSSSTQGPEAECRGVAHVRLGLGEEGQQLGHDGGQEAQDASAPVHAEGERLE